jgi:2-amino-4-hydroxy-6-hydroxymethyldihydropteridine diphosphokinase
MAIAYIALGANLGEPAQQLRAAIHTLASTTGIRLLAQSPLYRTAPLGPADQPYYCNAVCQVETTMSPEQLLEQMLMVERAAGRVRSGDRWGPRLLDLDLLYMEGEQRQTLQLQLPHPAIAQRNFVLVPLADIAPMLNIAGVGIVAEQAQKLGRDGLELWPE